MSNALNAKELFEAWLETAIALEDEANDFSDDTSTTGTVSVGGSVTGELNRDGDRDWFAVTLQAGRTYRIDLEGSETDQGTLSDPNLHGIYDANGVLIKGTSNDDGGVGLNSRIRFTPDEDGTYYVSAGAFVGGTGTYTLSAVEVTDDFSDNTSTSGKVLVGGSVEGETEENRDRDWFAVELEAGRNYKIDLAGSDTNQGTLGDPYLQGIFDASGERISGYSDDDGGIGHNSRIEFTPDEDGTYFVSASGGRLGETGTYTLSVREGSDDFSDDTSTMGKVSVGDSVIGEIEEEYDQDWFAVMLEAGKHYSVLVEGYGTKPGTLSTGLPQIYDESGALLSGSQGITTFEETSRIGFTPDKSGTYYVSVEGAFYGLFTGIYTLSVGEMIDDFSDETSTTGLVLVGNSVAGEIELEGDDDWFAVTLKGGRSYLIDLEGADTGRGSLPNPFVRGVYDANGVLFSGSWNNDSGVGSNSRVGFVPEEDGTYYVSVESGETSYEAKIGTYTLSVREHVDDVAANTSTTGLILVGDSVADEIELEGDVDWFAVTLVGGQSYVISLEGNANGRGTLSDPFLVGIYDANGDMISDTQDDDSGLGGNSWLVFTPDEDGTYYLSAAARYGSDRTGTYTLSVEKVTGQDGADTATEDGNAGVPGALGFLFEGGFGNFDFAILSRPTPILGSSSNDDPNLVFVESDSNEDAEGEDGAFAPVVWPNATDPSGPNIAPVEAMPTIDPPSDGIMSPLGYEPESIELPTIDWVLPEVDG